MFSWFFCVDWGIHYYLWLLNVQNNDLLKLSGTDSSKYLNSANDENIDIWKKL